MKSDNPVVSAYETGYSPSSDTSPWSPKTWSKKIWLSILAGILVVVAAVVGGVVGSRAAKNNNGGSYPNYSNLTYNLIDAYNGESFFDKFQYFHDYDPSGGFVHYVDPDYAKTYNLTYATSSSAIIRVDTTVGPKSTPDASTGRFSVRLESKAQYGPGLFLFDVKHTPYGCGTWPALWLTDPANWPTNGEIDLMEAVNQATSGNTVALHTTADCSMSDVRRQMTGTAGPQGDCHNSTNNNAGCTVSGAPATYGPDFNAAGGGVVALEWRVEGIRVWVFPRGNGVMPTAATVLAESVPNPGGWGQPLADFPSTGCDVASHFRNQSIVVNIDLCGYLTNAVWASSGCPSNCTDYVANNPSAFTNAYWEFGSFYVYKAL